MNGSEESVGDENIEKGLRSRARWIYFQSATAALILTILSFLFGSVLPATAGELSLEGAAEFLIRHGYVVLFGWVLLEQLGLPIPAAPLLIAAGALARSGKMNLSFAMALPFVALILADIGHVCFAIHRRTNSHDRSSISDNEVFKRFVQGYGSEIENSRRRTVKTQDRL